MSQAPVGAPKRGPGRPPVDGEVQRKRNITLSDTFADKARKIGGGNLSEGIRIALARYRH